MNAFVSQIGNALRCPASKFITHTLSHICFLILLAAATFRLEEKSYPIVSANSSIRDSFDRRLEDLISPETVDAYLKGHFRPANILMTNVQICLMFWVLGKNILMTNVQICLMFWVLGKNICMTNVKQYSTS